MKPARSCYLKLTSVKRLRFTETWDVIEPTSQITLGTIQSELNMLKPKWQVLDAQGQPIAEAAEDTKSMLEHAVAYMPRKYMVTCNGVMVGNL